MFSEMIMNESIAEGLPPASENRCMQCGMKNCKCPGNSCKCKPINGWVPGKGFKKAIDEAANAAQQAAIAIAMQKDHKKPKSKSITLEQQFDMIEEMVEQLAETHGVDAEQIWEDFESVDDHELFETAAWRRKEGKSKSGGLNAKGVASYRRENPGSKLQTAVTTKPSKLKPGSKAAKRRKSFCARMSGVDGPMKKPNGKPTRKALALRKWNC
jgi:gas vesicle protein